MGDTVYNLLGSLLSMLSLHPTDSVVLGGGGKRWRLKGTTSFHVVAATVGFAIREYVSGDRGSGELPPPRPSWRLWYDWNIVESGQYFDSWNSAFSPFPSMANLMIVKDGDDGDDGDLDQSHRPAKPLCRMMVNGCLSGRLLQ